MALERHIIEKKDFPLGRRGYDPAAVDAHLSTIADEVEALQQGRAGSPEPMATAVSEQVRGIVEAAEKGAAEIHARAHQEAREVKAEATEVANRVREEAERDVQRQREEAAQQARDHVGRISQSTSQMLERLQTIDGELGGLTASLRAGTERLKGELERLEGELGSLRVATAKEPEPEEAGDEPVAVAEEPVVAGEEPVAGPESAKVGDPPPEASGEPEPAVADAPAAASEAAYAEPVPEEAALAAAGDDSEGARLIALNMALNGTPREETDRYLAENFTLHDRASLLDEVYASVDG